MPRLPRRSVGALRADLATVALGILITATSAARPPCHGHIGRAGRCGLQTEGEEGGSWVNVDTVPDPVPGNPYVSATIHRVGTCARIQC
jgi:hypothetical protein